MRVTTAKGRGWGTPTGGAERSREVFGAEEDAPDDLPIGGREESVWIAGGLRVQVHEAAHGAVLCGDPLQRFPHALVAGGGEGHAGDAGGEFAIGSGGHQCLREGEQDDGPAQALQALGQARAELRAVVGEQDDVPGGQIEIEAVGCGEGAQAHLAAPDARRRGGGFLLTHPAQAFFESAGPFSAM